MQIVPFAIKLHVQKYYNYITFRKYKKDKDLISYSDFGIAIMDLSMAPDTNILIN